MFPRVWEHPGPSPQVPGSQLNLSPVSVAIVLCEYADDG